LNYEKDKAEAEKEQMNRRWQITTT